jgi:hypothetical protein
MSRQRDCYQLRAPDDEEIISHAESVYSATDLNSVDHTLDSQKFGATIMLPTCGVCFNQISECPGHYSVILTPFPIVRSVYGKDFKTLIPIICPICSKFPIINCNDALKLPAEDRLNWLKEKVTAKSTKNKLMICPHCNNQIVLFQIIQGEPTILVGVKDDKSQTFEELNPIDVLNVLQGFTDLEIAGFSPDYHPRKFMTSVIVIIPNKLRLKTQTESNVSTITSYYKSIISECIPELDKIYKHVSKSSLPTIPKGDIQTNFNTQYGKLNAYYTLITDMGTDKVMNAALAEVNIRDKKHIDKGNALMGKFKDNSVFSKGIIGSRYNISARSVLNGAFDDDIKNVGVPYHIASELTMLYPVYSENIKLMQQLVAAMSDRINYNDVRVPKVLGIVSSASGIYSTIHVKDAVSKAATLQPGDKLSISLMDGDFVMHCRFPAVREESWTSLQVMRDNNTIITLPLPDCKMKMADFDGDESQIYAMLSHATDLESLLLHSTFAQMLAYKDGNPAIWYSADVPYGIEKFKAGVISHIRNFAYAKAYDVLKLAESFIPKDFTYNDSKLEINNGKFGDKNSINNKEMHKYMAALYGVEFTESFMDKISVLAYDINRSIGNTLGYEIRVYGKDTKEKIKALVAQQYAELIEIEKSNIRHREMVERRKFEEDKPKILKLLIEGAAGTNLDLGGYIKSYAAEYYQTAVQLDYISDMASGTRMENILADNTRSSIAFPRYSWDPCAYGYVKNSYADDIGAVAHFYDCKQQRYAMYIKGEGTKKQGYLSKRLVTAFGKCYIDFDGSVITDSRVISIQYGSSGLSPRLAVAQNLYGIKCEKRVFVQEYGSDKRLVELYDALNYVRQRYAGLTCTTSTDEIITGEFIAGFNYEQYIDSHCEQKRTDQKDIDRYIKALKDIYDPNNTYISENFMQHEYYFRAKMQKRKVTDDVFSVIFNQFKFSLVGGGEPAGIKAAIATSEPLTQATLHAIHGIHGGAGFNNIRRQIGTGKFEELLGGISRKNTVVTLVLYDTSKEAAIEFANEQETFYLADMWSRSEIRMTRKIDERLVEQHINEINLNKDVEFNIAHVTMIWNVEKAASFNVHIIDIIRRLEENYDEILFITGFVLNDHEFMAYIFFKPDINIDTINNMCETWKMRIDKNIVHGKYIVNSFVSENKNKPGTYIIEANEIDPKAMTLENLILDERIDPAFCKTTDSEVTLSIFGINEASARHYEELIYTATNLSETKGILNRHYKLISDTIFVTGEPLYADRYSIKHDEYFDPMRSLSFETAKAFIQDTLKSNKKVPVSDTTAAAVFGELSSQGTGVSKIIIYGVDK